MKILLLQNVMRGAAGGIHPSGSVLDVPNEAAARLIASGAAVLAPSEEKPSEPAAEKLPEVLRSQPRAHSKK